MTQLASALDRLLASLVTLEAAAKTKQERGTGDAQAQPELEQLRADRDRLSAELDTLRSESIALEEVTDEVAGRLDGAIAGIREVLEG